MTMFSTKVVLVLASLAARATAAPQCSANPACSALSGNCCPTSSGVTLSCCDGNTPGNLPAGSCSANSACSASGLTGECCPTVTGLYLDCCDGNSPSNPIETATCSSHVACSSLIGDCCPTQDGVTLDCCDSAVVLPVSACAEYSACTVLGLTGVCCPTTEGVYLECCDGLSVPAEQCSAHAACSSLTGNCCPTTDGMMLDCCNGQTMGRECSANPACSGNGLQGNCCPTDFGQTLDCCNGGTPVNPLPTQTCSQNSACASLGLIGNCCPTDFGQQLHCCDNIFGQGAQASSNSLVGAGYASGTDSISVPAPIDDPMPSPMDAPTQESVLSSAEIKNKADRSDAFVPNGVGDKTESFANKLESGSGANTRYFRYWTVLGLTVLYVVV